MRHAGSRNATGPPPPLGHRKYFTLLNQYFFHGRISSPPILRNDFNFPQQLISFSTFKFHPENNLNDEKNSRGWAMGRSHSNLSTPWKTDDRLGILHLTNGETEA